MALYDVTYQSDGATNTATVEADSETGANFACRTKIGKPVVILRTGAHKPVNDLADVAAKLLGQVLSGHISAQEYDQRLAYETALRNRA